MPPPPRMVSLNKALFLGGGGIGGGTLDSLEQWHIVASEEMRGQDWPRA